VLRISNQQLAALTQALDNFEDRMLLYLNRSFPTQCAALGESNTRKAIQYGLERAASYGMSAEPVAAQYIYLMFVLGPDYDQDARLPWVRPILSEQGKLRPDEKLARLYQEAMRELAHAGGLVLPLAASGSLGSEPARCLSPFGESR
jgi:hypothetical protein